MNYQRLILNLTSFNFIFSRTFSFFYVYLAIILLILIQLNENGVYCTNLASNYIQFNNDYIRNTLYSFKSLVNEDVLEFKDNDFNSSTTSRPKFTLKQITNLLASSDARYARLIEITGLAYLFYNKNSSHTFCATLIELFFPLSEYGEVAKLDEAIRNEHFDLKKFKLEYLNMSANALTEHFLDGYSVHSSKPSLVYSTLYGLVLVEYFSHLRMLQLSHNKLRHLERKHFEMFAGSLDTPSRLETLLLNSNELSSVRHDTFYDLKSLKYLDLSGNKLKLIHPLTFSMPSASLYLISLENNQLKTIFNTPHAESSTNRTNSTLESDAHNQTHPLASLKHLYLQGNDEIYCDCGLIWLYRLQSQINLPDFKCNYVIKNKPAEGQESELVKLEFSSIESENHLNESCQTPSLHVNTDKLEESSDFSLFRMLAKRWFAWTVFVDVLPVTTPTPYLMANERPNYDDSNENELNKKLIEQEKHVFHSWRLSDAVFECTNLDSNQLDESKSTIVWKTQYGYFSYLDADIMESMRDDALPGDEIFSETSPLDSNRTEPVSRQKVRKSYNSFKIFYKMNKLTRIHKHMRIAVGSKYGALTTSEIYVNEKNELIVTNMRQAMTGPFVCLAVNERGIRAYEYDMHVRAGVSEIFIYSLFVSLVSMILPSIAGLIICCYCEYEADKNYPMTPPCYPTPMASTPPNFDFNEWMANAASYLPNINLNIHYTLEQVSKKLRKGMEKASVTVKSLGMTSSAYIYSMYEQSTQRWSDIKGYVPSLNMPTLNLPTMRYPPVGQLANRMRMGMGNFVIQLREFCGTSDLTHTASIVDIESDTNASNAVGKTYIMEQFDRASSQHSQQHNFYRFLNLIKEESRLARKAGNGDAKTSRQGEEFYESELAQTPGSDGTTITMEMMENRPTTSAQASLSEYAAASSSVSGNNKMPKVIYVQIRQNIENDDDDDDDDDEEDVDSNSVSTTNNVNCVVNNDSNLKLEPNDNSKVVKKGKQTESSS